MIFETMNDASYRQEDGAIILHASAKSDFVVSPITGKAHASAAFLFQRVKGDSSCRQRCPSAFFPPMMHRLLWQWSLNTAG